MNARRQVVMALMKGFDDVISFGSFIGFCLLQQRYFSYINTDDDWIIEESRLGSPTFQFIFCMSLVAHRKEHDAFAKFADDAKSGSMLAMGALAYCYKHGIGIPENYAEAYVWASLAATAGLNRLLKFPVVPDVGS